MSEGFRSESTYGQIMVLTRIRLQERCLLLLPPVHTGAMCFLSLQPTLALSPVCVLPLKICVKGMKKYDAQLGEII